MNKTFFGDYAATIVRYDAKSRTAKVTIPSVTDGLDEGIEATFAYPVGHDDKDTEIEILDGAECYVFFLQGDPASPVIWAYRSHGTGAVVDTRRIRQANIELLARANINLKAEKIDLTASQVVINADNLVINANTANNGTMQVSQVLNVAGKSNLNGGATVSGKPYETHAHNGVQSGNQQSGGVV